MNLLESKLLFNDVRNFLEGLCDAYDFELKSQKPRHQDIKQLLALYLREYTETSLNDLTEMFKYTHRSTFCKLLVAARKRLECDKWFQEKYRILEKSFK